MRQAGDRIVAGTSVIVLVVGLGAMAALPPAEERTAPFSEIRWSGWVARVKVNDVWYELDSINGVRADDIISFCRRVHRDKARKRFSEDLVQVLEEMGMPLPARVSLTLRPEADREKLVTLTDVPMTKENRRSIWEVRKTQPDPDEDDGGSRRLTDEQARADLDTLQKHLRLEFSYLRLKGVDFAGRMDRLRSAMGNGATVRDLAIEIARFLAEFGDGHSGVRSMSDYLPRGYLPFLVDDSAGRVVARAGGGGRLLDPDRPYVRSLDGLPLSRWVEAAGSWVAKGSPQLIRHRSIDHLAYHRYLCGTLGLPERAEVAVELESEDGRRSRTLTIPISNSRLSGELPEVFRVTRLPSGFGYLRIGQMTEQVAEQIPVAMESLRETPGLVIDVRGNGGGLRHPLRALFPYFMEPGSPPRVASVAAYRLAEGFKPDHLAERFMYRRDDPIWTDPQHGTIDEFVKTFRPEWRPTESEFSEWHFLVLDRTLQPKAFIYGRPVAVLMDSGCFSATDIFLGALKGWKNVRLIGTPSGGGSGRAIGIQLPESGIEVRLSTMVSFQPNGLLYDTHGVIPDETVEPTPTDLTGETDSQLDAAVRYLKGAVR